MINLLPPETTKSLQSRHFNLVCFRFIVITICAAAFLALACLVTYSLLENSEKINNELAASEQKSSSYLNQQETVTEAQNNLAISNNILNQEIKYSKIITGIASSLPTGAIIKSIKIDNSTVQMPISIELSVKSTDVVNQLNNSFQNSRLFSSYELSTASNNSSDTSYPVTVSVEVTINKAAVK